MPSGCTEGADIFGDDRDVFGTPKSPCAKLYSRPVVRRDVGRYRILFVSDLHGSDVCFRKFLNSTAVYHPDLLIYGGDVMGKMLVPIFPDDKDGYRWFPNDRTSVHVPPEELPNVQRKIADNGRYSAVMTPEEWRRLHGNPDAMNALFTDLAHERVRTWMRLVKERLTPTGIPLVMNVGNDDTDDVLDLLKKEAPENVLIPEGQVVRAGPYEIFGCGYANMTPWRCPRDLEEADLEKFLDKTATQIDNPRQTILDIHAPPSNTSLDLAPELDEDFRPKTIRGEVLLGHVGSTSVRALIESIRPLVGLHGHIHEGKGLDEVAGTPVYNPGSTYFSGSLQGLLLDLDGPDVAAHLFVTG